MSVESQRPISCIALRIAMRPAMKMSSDTTPAKIYEVLTDSTLFSKMSGGAPTEIDALRRLVALGKCLIESPLQLIVGALKIVLESQPYCPDGRLPKKISL